MLLFKPKQKPRGLRLYCFSPPVMVATFAIEIGLLFWTVWHYKLNPATRLIALLLFFLAVFQLAEFYVCTGGPQQMALWARTGFVSITLLPVLSMHLIQVISKRFSWLVYIGYASAAPWVALFLMPRAFRSYTCGGNYVMFNLHNQLKDPYLAYYYIWLLIGLVLCAWMAAISRTCKQRRALYSLGLGYVSFILPTTIINAVRPDTVINGGLPSIMCGFAVLYAVVLVLLVAPATARPHNTVGRRT